MTILMDEELKKIFSEDMTIEEAIFAHKYFNSIFNDFGFNVNDGKVTGYTI